MEHPNLFRRSAAELRHPRCLALTALFISLNIAMDLLGIRIQLTPTIRIGPGFLCNACIGMLFGPFVAMLAGICTDTLGYLVNSGGAAYFPGYMLTAMLGGILHGLFLYPAGRSRSIFPAGYSAPYRQRKHGLTFGIQTTGAQQNVSPPIPRSIR